MDIFPFIITLLAGLSTIIGSFLMNFNKNNKILISSLAFAAAVMMSVSFLDLIPESIHLLTIIYDKKLLFLIIGTNILAGLFMAYLVDLLADKLKGTKLYKVGIVSMMAIILHNIPEGIATFMAGACDTKLGLTLAIAIGLHNIPEGITIAIPIYYATGSKKKAFLYTLLSGLSEFLGALLAAFVLTPYLDSNVLGSLFAIIAGLMFYISMFELLPLACSYHEKRKIIVFFLIGILVVTLNSIFF